MSYLGCEQFMVLGCCIGGPFIWNMLQRAPERVVAAVLCQPSGFRPESADAVLRQQHQELGPAAVSSATRAITMEMVDQFLNAMYTSRGDFVFTATRDFVRSCQTPVLVMPDDVPAHPYAVAMESASLAPNSEVTIYPWKDTPEHLSEAVAHVRRFLLAHEPAMAR